MARGEAGASPSEQGRGPGAGAGHSSATIRDPHGQNDFTTSIQ